MKKLEMIFVASMLAGLVFSSCSLKPLAYSPEKAPPFEGVTQLNKKLLKFQLNQKKLKLL